MIQEQPDQASLTERYVEECVRFMRDNRDRAFFLYLAHMYVHLPLYVAGALPATQSQQRPLRRGGGVHRLGDRRAAATSSSALGLDENTLVIFTSDNGRRARRQAAATPLRGTKGTTWEGGMRVPCIVRWPGRPSRQGVRRGGDVDGPARPSPRSPARARPRTGDRRPRPAP